MTKVIMKYNPAFLSPDELVVSFVVRHRELETIVRIIKENVTKSNQHILVIGPRGIGKTMLVLRAAEEVRRDKKLSKKWYPLVFSEESYQVSTCGEFWLEALFHLGQQTKDERWQRTYEELKDEADEKRLRERALAQLMDFADKKGKRILLVVENLNMLLGDQLRDEDAWAMRHTLQNEPRIMLLASATSRFEQVEVEGKPMFDLFRFIEIKQLDGSECRVLWATITGEKLNERRIRPLEILTGGNPRLLAIVSNFAAKMSLKELMNDLIQLVDEHTEYFKSHLDNLPPIERKVYIALAEIWDPATARRVGKSARLNVSKTSSLLARLIERGAVVEANGRGKAKLYQVAERMYNIYYLMRRRVAASGRVKAVVRFMVSFYGPEELVGIAKRITEEACNLKPESREEHLFTYEALLKDKSTLPMRQKLIKAASRDFFEMPDVPDSIKRAASNEVLRIVKRANDLGAKGQRNKAERLYREAIDITPKSAAAWAGLGIVLRELSRFEEAEQACRKVIELVPQDTFGWGLLGYLLHEHLQRYKEAEIAYRKAIELAPKDITNEVFLKTQLSELLDQHFERYEEAETLCREVIKLKEDYTLAWMHLGSILHYHFGRYEEAEEAYRKVIKLAPEEPFGWGSLADLLKDHTKRYEEAEQLYHKALELSPDDGQMWLQLGNLLHEKLGRYEEAEKAYRRTIELKPEWPYGWMCLGKLNEELNNYEEAEEEYRKALELYPNVSAGWTYFGLFLESRFGRFEEAERAYRKSIELDPHFSQAWWALICLLYKELKRSEDGSALLRQYLEDTEMVKEGMDGSIEMLLELAADGYEKEMLEIVRHSASVEVLEPLVVGLRSYVGEDVKAAAEIMEVAKDVVKRIEERRKQIEEDGKKK